MAQQDERIGYFSTLCHELYNPKSASERDQVQKILEASFPTFASDSHVTLNETIPSFHIANPTDTANALRILLENSPNPYVQTFALSRLKQLVLAQFTLFDNDTKIQLRKTRKYILLLTDYKLIFFLIGTFLLEYAYIHPDLQSFVITQLASVLAILTRFGWLEIDEYQNVYKDMTQFLQVKLFILLFFTFLYLYKKNRLQQNIVL